MCGGSNMGGSDATGTGNIPVIARALPALRNSENQNPTSAKTVTTTSGKDPQLLVNVGWRNDNLWRNPCVRRVEDVQLEIQKNAESKIIIEDEHFFENIFIYLFLLVMFFCITFLLQSQCKLTQMLVTNIVI